MADREYLEKHKIAAFFEELTQQLIEKKPEDPYEHILEVVSKKVKKTDAKEEAKEEAKADAKEEKAEAKAEEKKEDAKAPVKTGKVDWAKLKEKLPWEKNDEQKAKRKELFKQFDPNGNGYLSLAEVDKACQDVLNLHEVFDAKPVIMRAFQAAKNQKREKPGAKGAEYVEFCEFRMLLWYLRQYFELYEMFDAVDTEDDRRINLDEFKKAVPTIETWGVKIPNPEETFKEVDKNGGGQVLFIEFCDWAFKKGLDLVDDDE